MSEEGADVLLTDMGDNYLAEFITPKGENLLEKIGDLPAAGGSADEKKKELSESAEKEIKSHIPAKEIKPWLDDNFEHPFWDTIHQSCLAWGSVRISVLPVTASISAMR
jgi:hypothetical protein